MSRVAIIGNAGAGKSTLARAMARQRRIKHVEIDRLLWQPGWVLTSDEIYEQRHSEVIGEETWIIDGLGQRASIPSRLARATEIILVDMPLWMHFWLAAERQSQWALGMLEHVPGGIGDRPSTKALFETIWEVDQTWMPEIRRLCAEAERAAKPVLRLSNVEELGSFTASFM